MSKEFNPFIVEDAFVENRNNQLIAGPFSTLLEAEGHIEGVLKPQINKEIQGCKFEKIVVSVVLFGTDTKDYKNRINAEIEHLILERDGLHPIWRE